MKLLLKLTKRHLKTSFLICHNPHFQFSYLNLHKVDTMQITRFLKDNSIEFKTRINGQIVCKICPLCPKPHNNLSSNMWTLNLKGDDGAFLCFRCGNSGNWPDFVKSLMVGEIDFMEESKGQLEEKLSQEKIELFWTEKMENLRQAHLHLTEECDLSKLKESDLRYLKMLHYLTDKINGRGLNYETLIEFGVGIGQEMFKNASGEYDVIDCVYFPGFGKNTHKVKTNFEVRKTKIRGLYSGDKHNMRIHPSNASFGVFGMQLASRHLSKDSVIITEGEFDAMAAYQATGIPAISLPYGASNLPPEMVAYLKDTKKIFLWMDFDEMGQLNTSTYAERLGASRTFVVKEFTDEEIDKIMQNDLKLENKSNISIIGSKQTEGREIKGYKIKDANDALKAGTELVKEYINRAKSFPQMNIIKFSQLRDQVRERIFHADRFRGVSSYFFSWFNSLMKGFRRGE